MGRKVRIGFTRDFLNKEGKFALPGPGLKLLQEMPGATLEAFSESLPEVTPEQIQGFDIVISRTFPRWTDRSFISNSQLLSIHRNGVGYDRVDQICTVLIQKFGHSSYAKLIGGNLGPEVASGLLLATHIGGEPFQHIFIDFAPFQELHARYNEPFLKDVRCYSYASGGFPANIHVMGGVSNIAEDFSVVMDGRDKTHVIEMDHSAVRIVDQYPVSGLEVRRTVLI